MLQPPKEAASEPGRLDDLGDKTRPTAIDLFCGAGGFSLGLERAGLRVVGAADNWERALTTYRANFNHAALNVDLGCITGKQLLKNLGLTSGPDVLVGGPPCQGFSIQRIGKDEDHRNNLVLEYGRLIAELRPKLFVMENVPGLIGKRGKALADEFVRRLSSDGYLVNSLMIDAADYGVAQHRRRVVFIGQRMTETPLRIEPPSVRRVTSVLDAIGDLPEPPADLSPLPGDPLHRRTRLSVLNQRRMALIPPGGGMQDLPYELRVDCHKPGADKVGHRYVYGRLAPDRPAATITARFDSFTRGKFGHPITPRNITLREGARLQSFPDSFVFTGSQEEIAAQIGNAVPPKVAEFLGHQMIAHLQAI